MVKRIASVVPLVAGCTAALFVGAVIIIASLQGYEVAGLILNNPDIEDDGFITVHGLNDKR